MSFEIDNNNKKNFMQVSIFKPTKTAMQSGSHNCKDWLLKFNSNQKKVIEPIMGWTSSQDTLGKVKIKFPDKESAIKFAKQNNLTYEIIEPQTKKFVKRSYADNFK